MIEALPSAVSYVIQTNGVQALVEKLTEIEYIDLAEQIMCVLKNIAQEYPASIMKDGKINDIITHIYKQK